MSIGNKKEALIRAIKNSKCCCNKDSSDEQRGDTINYDELAEKFKNFYIYPKKDKARLFQDGVDGEYDASENTHQNYTDIADGSGYITDESLIIGTANVGDYFEVSDIEVFKLLAIVVSRGRRSGIYTEQEDTSKVLGSNSTYSESGLRADDIYDKEIQGISIVHYEEGDDSSKHPHFGVVLTPEDFTKFYVLATPE